MMSLAARGKRGLTLWLSVFDSRILKHGGTEKTEKGRNGMDGNVVIHVCCKETIGVGNLSDLCFLRASVFQILLRRSEWPTIVEQSFFVSWSELDCQDLGRITFDGFAARC